MSDLPERVVLGPFEYRVSVSPDDWAACDESPDDHWGYTDHRRGVILLSANASPSMHRTCLLHEVMHAAMFSGGVHYKQKLSEEKFILAASAPLLDALRRSPGLAEFLRAE